jgi:lipopolysaccharide/colanic/teichoic acid biosynthesis glycosyltransferase
LANSVTSELSVSPALQGRSALDEPADAEILNHHLFMKMLCVERKRTERAGRRFVLMLLESATLLDTGSETVAISEIIRALSCSTRDTDLKGWYEYGSILGVIFTEIPIAESSVVSIISARVTGALCDALGVAVMSKISLRFHVFPDDCGGQGPDDPAFATIYPDLLQDMNSRRVALAVKRCIDIVGSLLALVVLLPLFLLIAGAVSLTSPGPILFRQKRLGQYGKGFTFLKFRSMYATSDPAVHEAYVRSFITARNGSKTDGEPDYIYKLTSDSRVTAVGRFLRRTSLDELPQFLNVLTGKMSLVGPRPPVPYEFASYNTWHKRRLIAVKPGITGLWQVEGRSRVKFDEMVRMDLEYAKAWSIWLDIKILLQTPRAVVMGGGAY